MGIFRVKTYISKNNPRIRRIDEKLRDCPDPV